MGRKTNKSRPPADDEPDGGDVDMGIASQKSLTVEDALDVYDKRLLTPQEEEDAEKFLDEVEVEDEDEDEEEDPDHTTLDIKQVQLTVTHDKLLASASKKRRRSEDEDPDWSAEKLDNVQTQSLKKRLTKLQAEKATIINEFAEKKKKLVKLATHFRPPNDASSELKTSMKVCRSFFSHLNADYIEQGSNHIVTIKNSDGKGKSISVVNALIMAMESAAEVLKAPSTTQDVDEKIKLVRNALIRRKEEELLAKQAKEREKLQKALARLDDSQLIDDNYDDHVVDE